MKIKKEHYEVLKSAIAETLEAHNKNDELVRAYQKGNFTNSSKVKDLQKRFCFDILYGSGLNSFVCDTLYKYMNDDHLYTALKSICPNINKS